MLQLFASEYRLIAQDVLSVVLLISAFIWGGAPERAVAAAWFLIFQGLSFLRKLVWPGPIQLMDIDIFLASTDVIACIVFVAIALYANRNYTLWIAAMQVLAASAHVARGLVESIAPVAYVVMVAAPGWIQLLILAIGLVRHVRRKRQYGTYRDWRLVANPGNFDVAAGAAGAAGGFPPSLGNPQESWRKDVR